MTVHVHAFEAHEGGAFRISLTYEAATGTGKTDPRTDTYQGHFAKLVTDTQVIEMVEFETSDPAFQGVMTITTTLSDAPGGTDVLVEHDGIPRGVSPVDNETGTSMSLAKLAQLVERGSLP